MYISANSGHHRASLAIQKALQVIDSSVNVLNINAFNYTHPILEKVINKTYAGIIKNTPEVWEYLYDNPVVFQKLQRLRDLIHNVNSEKLQGLLNSFQPDIIACTQAFPCGMIADLKKRDFTCATLFGILTDYNPHSYWIYDSVDYYITSTEQARQKLIESGIIQEKIKTLGIPIDPKFKNKPNISDIKKKLNLKLDLPTILIMGGGQGLGPIKQIVCALDRMDADLQIIALTGTNKKLYKWLLKKSKKTFKKHVIALEYTEKIDELMSVSTLIVTKPGGLTTAEALSKGLPIIIVNPIPGQEAKNTQFLAASGASKIAESYSELPSIIKQLLSDPQQIEGMHQAASNIGKPDSALDIARLMIRGG